MEYFFHSMGPAEKCLSDGGIDERNVHDVVLVGGLTRAQRHVHTGQLRLQLPRNQGHCQAKLRRVRGLTDLQAALDRKICPKSSAMLGDCSKEGRVRGTGVPEARG